MGRPIRCLSVSGLQLRADGEKRDTLNGSAADEIAAMLESGDSARYGHKDERVA